MAVQLNCGKQLMEKIYRKRENYEAVILANLPHIVGSSGTSMPPIIKVKLILQTSGL